MLGESYLFSNKYNMALDHLNKASLIARRLGQSELEAEWKATEG